MNVSYRFHGSVSNINLNTIGSGVCISRVVNVKTATTVDIYLKQRTTDDIRLFNVPLDFHRLAEAAVKRFVEKFGDLFKSVPMTLDDEYHVTFY